MAAHDPTADSCLVATPDACGLPLNLLRMQLAPAITKLSGKRHSLLMVCPGAEDTARPTWPTTATSLHIWLM